ncbi:HAMP domain-containing sensor histidine kinase [Rudanella lutea]|uniref:HAMP domain-containing sensor histidine kinase n=1 Tax=Rudanella lutea TaxID=451374 RepID=UPI000378DAA1|nr:HAMP domain-containing sensor histidine kinase [Rudanella lutea]
MNIRTRLTLLFTLLVASIMLLFSLSIYYLYNQFRENEFQQRLEDKAMTAARLLDDVGQTSKDDLTTMVAEQVSVYNNQDKEVYRSNQTNPVFEITPEVRRQARKGGSIRIRVDTLEAVVMHYYSPTHKQDYVMVASGYDRFGFSKLDRLREILFFGWLFSLMVVAVAGWLFSSDALRPVSELIEQAKAISGTNIHRRLRVGRQRDELAQLALTFNEMLQRLEEAFVTQKSFVSHASHELRTPLAVMMSQIDVALMQQRSTVEYEASLSELLDSVKNMMGLVNGLLELVRANSDSVTLNYQPVRVDELLWQARSALLLKQPDYLIEIDFENMPEQEEDLILLGESHLLTTAFQNLMENGCKYSSDHAVTVSLLFTPDQVQVSFVDEGLGIPAADLPHIFEPFYRADNIMTVKGHGIGLALTRRIINLHKGNIQVASVESVGTTITVTFPLREPTPAIQPLLEETAE